MASSKHRRTAWATGLSLGLHVLALTGMAAGVRGLAPPPEGRAVEVQLIPAPELRIAPKPEPSHRAPEREIAAPPLRPTPAPAAPQTPLAALPAAPTPAPAAQAEAGPEPGASLKGLAPSLSGRLGCDDAPGRRLTTEQRLACEDNYARLAERAPDLGLTRIPADKKKDYDLWVHCGEVYRHANIPPTTQYRPDGAVVTGVAAGIDMPGMADCPVKDR